MARNTGNYIRRSVARYATSLSAWQDILLYRPDLHKGIVTVAHTKAYWRWKINRPLRGKKSHRITKTK